MLNALRVLILSLLLAGCTKDIDYQTLTIPYSTDIRGFDPAFATDLRTGKVVSLLYDNLVRFDLDMNLVPGAAKHWSVSADGRKYTFIIRNNIRFHNGDLLTVDDIIISFERILNPQTSSPQTWLLDRITGAKDYLQGYTDSVRGLTVINDSTLTIELDEPFSPFIQYLAMPATAIINKNEMEHLTNIPAGSGPWKLDKWERDGEILFTRNIDYWDGSPKIEHLRIRILSEIMTQSAEFEAGSLDIYEVPKGELEYWRDKDYNKKEENELIIRYVGMNCSRPPFDNIYLRKAMNYAVDREKIIHILLNGSATITSGPVPPRFLTGEVRTQYEYNPGKAIDLLKKAGYKNGLNTELYVAGGSEMFHVLEALQSDWAAVGINVEIKRSDWNVFKTAVREGKPDLYYLDWYADYPDGENFLYPLFHSKESMTKRNRFSDPDVDAIIEKIQRLPDNAERQNLIVEANNMIADKAPWVFLWHSKTTYLTQKWIGGFRPSPIFNAQRYTLVTKQIGS
jgi:peptide/nickel transport system substrate-binding protein/oligopeptide transport system substrate-binding protein